MAGADGKWWGLILRPPTGQSFEDGTTYRTTRFGGDVTAGLDLFGDGRGCNTSVGELKIRDIEVAETSTGAQVTVLDADFTQHCEGDAPAAYGTVRIGELPPPPPAPQPPLVLTVANGATAGLDAKARPVVSGSVTCTSPAQVDVTGTFTQTRGKQTTVGGYQTSVACTPGAPVTWQATATRVSGKRFWSGVPAIVDTRAESADVTTGNTETTAVATDVDVVTVR